MSSTLTTAYAGGFAGMVKSLFNNTEALQAGLFRTEMAKYKHTFGTLDATNVSQLYRDTPTDRGALAIGEKVVDLDDFIYYLEFNPQKGTFKQYWVGGVETGEEFASLPSDIVTPVMDEFLGAAGSNFNDSMYQGASTPTEALPFTGLVTNMLADANVRDVTSPLTITANNALSELDRVRQRCTAKMKKAAGFAYQVDYDWYEFLLDAHYGLITTQSPLRFNEANEMLFYRGVPVHAMTGLTADHAVAGVMSNDTSGNFGIAWDNAPDVHPVLVDRVQNNSAKWFFKMTMSVGIDVIKGADSVLYGA